MPRVSHVQEETIISDRVHCVQCITQSRPVTDDRIRSLARPRSRGRCWRGLVIPTRPAAKDHLPRLITRNHAPSLSPKRDENHGDWFLTPRKRTRGFEGFEHLVPFQKLLAIRKKLRKGWEYIQCWTKVYWHSAAAIK